jgi:hypothetical protein
MAMYADQDLAFTLRYGASGDDYVISVAKAISRRPINKKVVAGITNTTSGRVKVSVIANETAIEKNVPIARGDRHEFELSKPEDGHFTFRLEEHEKPSAEEGEYRIYQSGGTDQGDIILLP